jgi:RNA polymerase sigma-70 factor (ECF subfamily)
METDITLLTDARRLSEDALVKIFDLYAPALYHYALRVCGDPVMADHIVGDVFASFLEQLASGNGPSTNLRSYLYQTAHNLIVDQARSSERTIPLEAADHLRYDARSVSLSLEDRLMLELILEAVQNDLTNDQRHVVILRFLEGFSLRETATIIGKEVNHVKVLQNRAIAKIRRVFISNEMKAAASCPKGRDGPKVLLFS